MDFAIVGLDHVVLRVSDLARAMKFYQDVLGCHEERRLEDLGLYQFRAGASIIDLVDIHAKLGGDGGPPHPTARNMDHFCVRVEPFDEAVIQAHLRSHGIETGPAVERYGAEGNGLSIYLKDPDGNTVELKGPPLP